MKIQNIVIAAVLAQGLLQAAPHNVTIENQSSTTVQFALKIRSQNEYHFLKAGEHKTFDDKYTPYTEVSALKKGKWIRLDLQYIQGPIPITWDGNALFSTATKSKPSTARLMGGHIYKGLSYHLIALQQWSGTVWKKVHEKWNSMYQTGTVGPRTNVYLINQLDIPIKVSLYGGLMDFKVIIPSKEESFGLLGNGRIDIYLTKPILKTDDIKKPILEIDLQKYIDNPKAGADLNIHIQKRAEWTNNLFSWMPNWSKFTYSAKWVKMEFTSEPLE